MEQLVLGVVVLVFALVNGVNDGGTVVSTGLRTAVSRPWLRLLVLVVVLGLAPVVFGTRVASTLAERLVDLEGDAGQAPMVGAVVAVLVVVWWLTARGWPTSLTLGLIGALAGAGLAAGLAVDAGLIALVLLIGALAPLAGLAGALLLHRLLLPLLGPMRPVRRALPSVGHLLQCLAYGTNDGQKLLAVLAVALGSSTGVVEVGAGWWAAVVATFALGSAIGIARLGRTLDTKLLPLRTEQVSLAQLSGSGAVLASAAVASPVSLIQALSGGLVGSGISVTPRRVRWTAVSQIGLAWVLTLPASFIAGAVLAAGLQVVWS